jgi:hypothetical protein
MQKCYLVYRIYTTNITQVKEIVKIFRNRNMAQAYAVTAEKHFYWLVGQFANQYPEASVHDIIEKYVRNSEGYNLMDAELTKSLPPFDLAYVVEQNEINS